jgi:hypothetical protein
MFIFTSVSLLSLYIHVFKLVSGIIVVFLYEHAVRIFFAINFLKKEINQFMKYQDLTYLMVKTVLSLLKTSKTRNTCSSQSLLSLGNAI